MPGVPFVPVGVVIGDALAKAIHQALRDDRRELEDAKADRRAAPLPPVEVGRRDATEEEIGDNRSGRRQMLKAATKAGWTVWATYARGPIAHGTTGEFLRMVDSLALRMTHPSGHRAVATWEDGDFYGAWWLTPLKAMSSPELKRRIQNVDTEPVPAVVSTPTEGE